MICIRYVQISHYISRNAARARKARICTTRNRTLTEAGAAARVANATAEHLKIEALYGAIQPMNVQGQGSQEVTDTFKVVPRANALESTGSNALTFSLAAIP